jgi:outer membrane protein assembly factor BamB
MNVMTRRLRIGAAEGVLAVVLVACSASGSNGSAASIVASPSLAPNGSASAEPFAEAVIATGPGPVALAATSESIWVELHRADLVAHIDPATNQQLEITNIPVHCALAASGESVWATIAKRDQVWRFAASTGEKIELFDIRSACGLAVEGDTAWVTSPHDGAVYLLQEGVPEPIRQIDVAPDIFDIALDDKSAWVTSESDGGTLWRIDRSTYESQLVGAFPGVSADSIEVAFGSVWITSRSGGHVWKLDPTTGSVLGTFDLKEPWGVAAAGDALWITQVDGGLTELDPDTLEVRAKHQLPFPWLAPPLYAFGSLWISALEDDVVLRIPIDN